MSFDNINTLTVYLFFSLFFCVLCVFYVFFFFFFFSFFFFFFVFFSYIYLYIIIQSDGCWTIFSCCRFTFGCLSLCYRASRLVCKCVCVCWRLHVYAYGGPCICVYIIFLFLPSTRNLLCLAFLCVLFFNRKELQNMSTNK